MKLLSGAINQIIQLDLIDTVDRKIKRSIMFIYGPKYWFPSNRTALFVFLTPCKYDYPLFSSCKSSSPLIFSSSGEHFFLPRKQSTMDSTVFRSLKAFMSAACLADEGAESAAPTKSSARSIDVVLIFAFLWRGNDRIL